MMMMMMMYSTLQFIVIIVLAGAWSKCTAKCLSSVLHGTNHKYNEWEWRFFGFRHGGAYIDTIWLCVLSVKLRQSTRPQRRCARLYGDRVVNNLRNITAHLHMHRRTDGQTDRQVAIVNGSYWLAVGTDSELPRGSIHCWSDGESGMCYTKQDILLTNAKWCKSWQWSLITHFNVLNPNGLALNNSTFCPRSVFMYGSQNKQRLPP